VRGAHVPCSVCSGRVLVIEVGWAPSNKRIWTPAAGNLGGGVVNASRAEVDVTRRDDPATSGSVGGRVGEREGGSAADAGAVSCT
jgi:hypothetical protein